MIALILIVAILLNGCMRLPPSDEPTTGPWIEKVEKHKSEHEARTKAEAAAAKRIPCEDSLFVALGRRDLDSLSEREYAYFLEMQRQCGEWQQASVQARGSGQSGWAIVGICLTVLIAIGVASSISDDDGER